MRLFKFVEYIECSFFKLPMYCLMLIPLEENPINYNFTVFTENDKISRTKEMPGGEYERIWWK